MKNLNQLFNSFALEGKITEKHAKEIKAELVFYTKVELLGDIISTVENIDVSGGDSGRDLKTQLLGRLNTLLAKI
ncbi:MAG: hypothetical protein WC262_07725 [Bacteroidales bacterium]|jgi:hypothetical protein